MFDREEYLLADSGYPASNTIVAAYKEDDASSRIPLALRKRFNLELWKQRVTLEHTLGILNSRFQSLRGLRNIIKFAHVLFHIRACVVIHNITSGLSDDTFWDDQDLPHLRAEWEAEANSIRKLLVQEFQVSYAKI